MTPSGAACHNGSATAVGWEVLLKRFFPFVVPFLLFGAALLAAPHADALAPVRREMSLYAPWIIVAAGMILSERFHRGRSFLVFLILALYYVTYRNYSGSDIWQPTLVPLLFLLVPIDTALISLMREKGILTVAGRARLVFIGAQAAIVAWVVRFGAAYAGIPALISRPFTHRLPDLAIPQTPLLLFAVAIPLTGYRSLLSRSPVDEGIFAVTVGMLLAGFVHDRPFAVAFVVTAAGLSLVLALLRESYNLAFRDDLTGLPGRRALNEQFQRIGKKFVIAMVDVDHFKSFNDRYGHDVGDQVLKVVAKILGEVKGGGKAFRYGGEEFTVIFSGKSSREAIPHLDALRRGIEAYPFSVREKTRPKDPVKGEAKRQEGAKPADAVTITVSMGIAESGENGAPPADILKAADKALYRAKNAGRNRISR